MTRRYCYTCTDYSLLHSVRRLSNMWNNSLPFVYGLADPGSCMEHARLDLPAAARAKRSRVALSALLSEPPRPTFSSCGYALRRGAMAQTVLSSCHGADGHITKQALRAQPAKRQPADHATSFSESSQSRFCLAMSCASTDGACFASECLPSGKASYQPPLAPSIARST